MPLGTRQQLIGQAAVACSCRESGRHAHSAEGLRASCCRRDPNDMLWRSGTVPGMVVPGATLWNSSSQQLSHYQRSLLPENVTICWSLIIHDKQKDLWSHKCLQPTMRGAAQPTDAWDSCLGLPRMITSPSPTASVQHLAPRLYEAMPCPSVLHRPSLFQGQLGAEQTSESGCRAAFWLAELTHTPTLQHIDCLREQGATDSQDQSQVKQPEKPDCSECFEWPTLLS